MKDHRNELGRGSFLKVIGSGALAAAASKPAMAQSLTTVQVGMSINDALTPLLYANQTGMFRDAGLDVQLNHGANGAALAAAIVGGTLNIGQSSLMPLLNGYLRGVRLPVIAGSSLFVREAPTSMLVVLKDSPIKTAADIKGSTVATQALRSLDELAIRVLTDVNHGNSQNLKFVEIPYPLMLDALQKQRADVASMVEPYLETALQSGAIRTIAPTYSGIAERLSVACYFATPAYIAQNRSVVDRFTQVLYKASQYTNTHHAETVNLLADYAHLDPNLVRHMTRGTNATSLDLRLIQPAIDVAAKYQYLERSFNAKELLA